jgi:hypothetical protein
MVTTPPKGTARAAMNSREARSFIGLKRHKLPQTVDGSNWHNLTRLALIRT